MSPEDPRHGSYAGYVAHWRAQSKLCDPCVRAGGRRRKLNRLRRERGNPGLVPLLGTVRRLHALQALGYGMPAIARECGVGEATLHNPAYRGTYVHRSTAAAVALVYERLCMTTPVGAYASRSRRIAARKGWVPPLGWDDIDDPHELPASYILEDLRSRTATADDVDEAVVLRILAGDSVPASPAERAEVARCWRLTGRPLADLARLTGWKVERYYETAVAS